ncbi:DNA-binding response regulator, OmpR family, contains REC and winged-helix (wHTH) domain [Formivibrio citricus]|uniref:DNA-binding response regulator, OmpR family, contains REC and winged-helix (WHTH) domain n=1 Tax=Formivibrio citricus TaxID=83765 RepID=A0A1I5A499_9NEIS|nr:tetratricopeptide repeat-containing response regulator [Formivibrio citricus]SFN57304.1 DNA-binding response regulator, OmpR family, contains REC and winged-helix (wHTH) domain [Formivibrio citricus]
MAGLQDTFSDFSQRRFLIIDDFHGMQRMLRDMLRECGATRIDSAGSSQDAIKLLSSSKYDVVLCDFNLGPGKNGQQLLEEAKFRQWVGPACAWIMITAEKSLETVMGALEYLPDSYLIKPLTTALLQNRLTKIWARKRTFIDINNALGKKDYSRAIALCDQQMATDRLNAPELQRLKYQFLLAIGELAEARQLLEAVLAERDQPWAKVGLGRVLFMQGDYVAARDLLQQVINENRANIEAYDWLAKTLQQLEELEAAEQVLQRAVQLSPNSPQRQKDLGELALKLGNLDAAEKAFRKSMAVGEHSIMKTADAYVGLARVCSNKQQPEEALKTLGSMQKHFDGEQITVRAKAMEGMVYLQNNQPAKAREAAKALDALLATSGAIPEGAAGLEAAELLLNTGNKESATELLHKLVMNNHEDRKLANQVGEIFDQAGMHEEGAQLVALSRQEALELMNAGALLAQAGKLEEAVESMRNAKKLLPSNLRVLLNFAQIAISCMKQQGANEALLNETRQTLQHARSLCSDDKRLNQIDNQLNELFPKP